MASGLMLQNRRASPIFGFTERPFFAHSDKSFHHGTELKFALAVGNTVSPPSSTSELYKQQKEKGRELSNPIQNPSEITTQDHNLLREWQLTGT